MFRMNGMPRAQGCAGVAKHIHVTLGRDTAQAALSTVARPHLVHVLYRDIPFILNIKMAIYATIKY